MSLESSSIFLISLDDNFSNFGRGLAGGRKFRNCLAETGPTTRPVIVCCIASACSFVWLEEVLDMPISESDAHCKREYVVVAFSMGLHVSALCAAESDKDNIVWSPNNGP
jgi:hypothetical protein